MFKSLSYLALGDSYTIGEAVPVQESFPVQLVALLEEVGVSTHLLKIIAQTGWTTDELLGAVAAEKITDKFDIVTLLIGVNNQYRGGDLAVYTAEFLTSLKLAINFVDGDAGKVFVLSIPDWGVTDFAKNSGRDVLQISEAIDAFNKVNLAEAVKLGVNYIDITPCSREAVKKPSLIANDGLHPSGEMYAAWAKQVFNVLNSKILGL